jgi:hypothetical protein
MIVHDCIQGTPEWLQLRAGIPTASEFSRILTPKGALSKSADAYLNELLAERILHEPLAKAVTMWMQRGSEHEAEAVGYYEMARSVDTVPVGFCTNDTRTIGASPDRLVGEDGLLEIKVPSPGIHVGYLLSAVGAGDEYKNQIQGQLWVTGRQWVDIMSYNPGMPEALVRFERDEAHIETLSAAVLAFSDRLESVTLTFRDRGWIKDVEPEAEPEGIGALGITEEDIAHLMGTYDWDAINAANQNQTV